jgi:hypothetical protein
VLLLGFRYVFGFGPWFHVGLGRARRAVPLRNFLIFSTEV